jgi:serine/threonine-protein kinase
MEDRRSQLQKIFQAARGLAREERSDFLQEACGSDEDLRQQIQILLNQDEAVNSLLDRPAVQLAGALMSSTRTTVRTLGTRVGPYEFLSLLGSGGMGAVYRARDTRLNRTVAIKLVHPHLLVDADIRRRFQTEAYAVAGLSHPNIVALFDVGESDGSDFLVMEYVEGRTLKDVIASGTLSLPDVVQYGVQVANALAAAHDAGIIHRDIKPANVMITPKHGVKVLDFGLAKLASRSDDPGGAANQEATTPGTLVGTVSYMSPEQTRGENLDARTDVFSLGCVLYEAATGHPPFHGPSTLAIMHEIAAATPPLASTVNRNIPPAFDRVIERALAKNRQDRYGSAAQMAEDLQTLNLKSHLELPRIRTSASSASKSRRAAVLVFLLTLTAALTIGWNLRSWLETDDIAMLAVLPFQDLDGNASEPYFTQGITEDVIAQLGRAGSSEFGVIAGNSVWDYRDTRPSPRSLAADLGVGYVLTGSVRREGSTMRINVQLTRTRDEVQVWAESFEETSSNTLALQQEVAGEVALAVSKQLSRQAPATREHKVSIDAAAYDSYLRGRFYWNQRTEVSLKQAVDYFQQTISRAPQYAPAYSGLADAYAALVYGCYLAPSEGFSKVRAALNTARELDPEAAEVSASEGYMNMYFDWDFNSASRNLERAIALNPNYAPAHHWLGVLRTAMEDFPLASRALARARALDPGSLPILTDVGFQLHYSNRNTDAEEVLKQVFLRDPNFPLAHFWMGRVMHTMGHCTEGLSELEAVAASLRDWQPYIAAHGHVAGNCGDSTAARNDLLRFDLIEKNRFVTSYGRALIHAGLNDKEQTLVWLRRAVEERSHWLVWSRLDPRFNKVRAEPRFQEIVRQVFAKL